MSLEFGSSVIHYNRGLSLRQSKRYTESAAAFRKAIELSPGWIKCYWLLADALRAAGKSEEAVSVAKQAVELDPNADSHFGLACFLAGDQRFEESEAFLRKAVVFDPNHARANEALGLRLQQHGRFSEAALLFSKVISLEPEWAQPYLSLVQGQTMSESDRPMIARMEALLSRAGLNAEDMRQLDYALGKAYEDLGQYGKAMHHFDEANRRSAQIRSNGSPYSRDAQRERTNKLIEAFTRDFLETNHGVGTNEERPIFVVGMIRSGTTLVEQILSCHSSITPGDEIFFWTSSRVKEITNGLNSRIVDRPALARVAEQYRARLDRVDPDATRITDKMPLNFTELGAIRLLFPRARIIHCRRHPMDTCLSIYATALEGGDFLFDKGHIVFAYREYLRLMDHWRKVLPREFLFEIDYEDLVSEREPVIRKMLAFLNLDWEEACLNHENSAREVATPSRWQVRQPIYSTSVGRWRRYEPYLGEFKDLLDL